MKTKTKTAIYKQDASIKTKALKWTTIGLGIAIVALWVAWFVCDCIFISKGITMPEWSVNWSWNEEWYNIIKNIGIIVLAMMGAYIVLLLSYMVICGLNFKNHKRYYAYQLIATTISFIGLTICIVSAAKMMVDEKFVIDIILGLPLSFEVYHLDYLKWMSIAFGFTILTNVLMLTSFKPFNIHNPIKDCNLLILVFAAVSIVLFVPFALSLGWNDPFIGGAESISEWLALIQDPITWKHVVCQCVTSPMGVAAGMIMILMVIRLITVMFVYNQKWRLKKTHIIIFSIITFLVFAAFIVAHANKLDFVKLVNKYNELKLGCLLVVLAQTVTCLAAGTYCLISHVNYKKESI